MDKFVQVIAQVIGVALILILGYAYSITPDAKWPGLVVAFFTGIVAVLTVFVVYWGSHTAYILGTLRERITQLDTDLSKRIIELQAQINILQNVYLFLVDDHRLAERESRADLVWVMSPNLHYESDVPMWQDTVYNNILRGASYRYLLQDIPEMEQNFRNYRRKLTEFMTNKGQEVRPDQLTCSLVTFPIPTELVIYDPDSTTPEHYEEGFVVAPVQGARTNMRMDEDVRARAKALFRNAASSGRVFGT